MRTTRPTYDGRATDYGRHVVIYAFSVELTKRENNNAFMFP